MKKKFLEIIDKIQDCGAIKDGGLTLECCSNEALAELIVQNKCSLHKKIECGFFNAGLCESETKCQFQKKEEKSRYDKLRELTVDEVAEYIDNDSSLYLTDKICLEVNPAQDCECEQANCRECIKKWLMMPVKENEK